MSRILVDASVWIDHLRELDTELEASLHAGTVITHPFVIGELACGSLARRHAFLSLLADLPSSPVASNEEALGFVERHRLHGRGIGWIDVHLLAATALADDARLWTRDKRLREAAEALGLAYDGVRR